MKKIALTILMLSVTFAAASSYACGNHEQGDVNSSKADAGQGTVNSSASQQTATTAKSGEAVVQTTEYRQVKNSEGAQACPMNSNCCSSMKTGAKATSTKAANTPAKSNKAQNLSNVTDTKAFDQQ